MWKEEKAWSVKLSCHIFILPSIVWCLIVLSCIDTGEVILTQDSWVTGVKLLFVISDHFIPWWYCHCCWWYDDYDDDCDWPLCSVKTFPRPPRCWPPPPSRLGMQIVVIVLKMIMGIVRKQNRNIKDNGSSPWRGSPEPFYPPLPLPDPASEGRRRRRSLPRTSNLLSLLGSHPFLILRIRIRIPSLFPSPPPHSLPLRAITLSHILACHFFPVWNKRQKMKISLEKTREKCNGLQTTARNIGRSQKLMAVHYKGRPWQKKSRIKCPEGVQTIARMV